MSDLAALAFPPWRLSGVVVGALLNDPATLAALGAAVHAPPYKGPPRAPALYVKPRNTLAASGATTALPAGVGRLRLEASLGIVIGRAACRVRAADAERYVAGYTLVAELVMPHASLYRPNVPARAIDGSCVMAREVVPRDAVRDPDGLELRIEVEGEAPRVASTTGRVRPAARLIEDVTEFMTLHRGDVLLLGAAEGAPLLAAGSAYEVHCAAIGSVRGRVSAAVEESA